MLKRRTQPAAVSQSAIIKSSYTRHFDWEFWLCRVWLPLGLLIQLTGFFWFPDTHRYKVNVVNFLLLACLLSLLKLNAWRFAFRSSVLLLVLAYLVYMSAIPIVRQNSDPYDCAKWSFYTALYVIAIGYRLELSLQKWKLLLWISTSICAAAIVYGFCREALSLNQWSMDHRFTGSGALYNPLRSGHLFGFFFLTALWLIINSERNLGKLWSGIGIALTCLFGTIVTGSRSPLFAIALSTLFIVVFSATPKLLARYLVLGALAIGSVAIAFWDRLIERGLSFRPEIWREVIKLWRQNPWFGVGHNAPLKFKVNQLDGIVYDTHNIVLAVLFYGGIIGVFIFATMHINAFYRAFRWHRTSSEAILACTLMIYGMATLQFDGGSFISRPNEFWLLLWFPIAFWLNIEKKISLTSYDQRKIAQ